MQLTLAVMMMQASWKTQSTVLRPSGSRENLPTQMVRNPVSFKACMHTTNDTSFWDTWGNDADINEGFVSRAMLSSNVIRICF